MKKRLQIYITGNVQRIGFRVQAAENAVVFNISGKAMYIDDGILIEAEGDPEKLNLFVDWCRRGPENCTIDTFSMHEMQPIHYTSFEIIHGVVSSETTIDKFKAHSGIS